MFRRLTARCLLGVFLATLPGSPVRARAADIEGANVVSGQAQIETQGATTTITTGTRQTIIDYDRFGVSEGRRLQIDQPDAGSRTLNRVRREGEASRIDGELGSNGIVLILNPSGVFFGNKAVVDVGGLVAGAGALSNEDFLSGVDRFSDLKGDVGVAPGATLHAAGDIALLGRRVENLGTLASDDGMIAIVAGGEVRLTRLDGHVTVQVDAPPAAASPQAEPARFALTQGGSVEAPKVTLAVGDSYSLAMNHTGVTRADEIEVQAGRDGRVELAGTLDASSAAPDGRGGKIHVQGGEIAVDHARLDASGAQGGGEILVGGDVRGGGDLTPARSLTVGPDTVLVADARELGDGGKIVLYAVDRTAFQGALSARGGAQGGDGGFAEISAKQVVAAGQVDLGAAQGRAGTVLYDPDEVVICGGGTTLACTVGSASRFDESAIEDSTANTVIEALNRIYASGDFVGDSVTLKDGLSLTLRTTGTAPPTDSSAKLGIDLVKDTAEQENLEWRVSQGGTITLQTQLGALATTTATGPKANIVAGKLVADGAAYTTNSNFDNLLVPSTTPQGVRVSTVRGDIDVAAIESNGDDTVAAVGTPGQPGSTPGRTTSGGGDITVSSVQGDIEVGSIVAKGGNSVAGSNAASGNQTALQASPGGNGGTILVAAGASDGNGTGSLTIGSVDVTGGVGRGSLFTKSNAAVPASGGDGGAIDLTAVGVTGATGDPGANATVTGDLVAKGGDGVAVEQSVKNAQGVPEQKVVTAFGGTGGAISITARGNITVSATELNASGGDGSSSGGNAINSRVAGHGRNTAINIRGCASGGVNGCFGEVGQGGDLVVAAALIARGGDARTQPLGTGIESDELDGGSGGFGGNVQVNSEDGKLGPSPTLPTLMTVDASGGKGDAQTDSKTNQPPANSGIAFFGGGAGGSIQIGADNDLEVGQLTSHGGAGTNTFGGSGALGGINVTSDAGVVTLHGADSSGGDAARAAGADTGVALPGGSAGTIDVKAPGTDIVKDGVTTPVTGAVHVAGEWVARGGKGEDAEGNQKVNTVGTVRINTDGDIEEADSSALLRGHLVQLDAANIGSDPSPVSIAGTGSDGDRAVLTVSGSVYADVRAANPVQDSLDSVEVHQLGSITKTDTATTVLMPGEAKVVSQGATILHAVHTSDSQQTLTQLGRGNDIDPKLIYRLDVTLKGTGITQPVLAIQHDGQNPGINLGLNGGEIANGRTDNITPANRGAIQVFGDQPAALGTTQGTLRFTGSTLGTSNARLSLAGNGDKSVLSFDAVGDVHGAVTAPVAAVEVLQRDASAGTDIVLPGTGRQIVATGATSSDAHSLAADTRGSGTGSGSGLSYRLLEPSGSTAKLDVVSLNLGGAGLVQARGDVTLLQNSGNPTISTNSNALAIESSAGSISQKGDATSIAMGGSATNPQLVLIANTGVGSLATPLRTTGVGKLAGLTEQESFVLRNDGTGAGPMTIQRVTPIDPADVSTSVSLTPVAGVRAPGTQGDVHVDITQLGTPLVLGVITDGGEFSGDQVFSQGDLALRAQAGIEIGNARFVSLPVPIPDNVFLAHNDARLVAFGDLTLDGPISTMPGSIAQSDEDGAPSPRFVHGSLELEAAGTVHFTGDIGVGSAGAGDPVDGRALALLDTTRATVDGAGELTTVRVADARFRGTLDGPDAVELIAQDVSSSEPSPEGHVATALFEGNIGTSRALKGLDVQAERVVFTSADAIVTGAGGVSLSTNQSPGTIPETATLEDRTGGLSIQTSGDFVTGDADSIDKFSVAGPLSIQAAHVRAADLNAARNLQVDSPDIVIVARDPAPLETQSGGTVTDRGTDWVADNMSFSTVPTIDEMGLSQPIVTLGVGGGGVAAPGKLDAFEVRRYTSNIEPVQAGDMFGVDGQMLDLTPTGPRVVADPATALPRERATTSPSMPAPYSGEQPAAAPAVDAEQLLAFLRCGELGSTSTCDAAQTAPLEAVSNWQDSALATPRAAGIAGSWRDLRSRDLSAAFDAAGAGYRAQSGFGELDGPAFGKYIENSDEHEQARAAVRQLATILTEVDMLGLAPEAEAQVRNELAREFAAEADVPGFDADAVLAAVAATPIGLPPAR